MGMSQMLQTDRCYETLSPSFVVNIQCPKKKETLRPETGKIIFSYQCGSNYFCPIVSFGGNSGPVPGRKVSFFKYCITNVLYMYIYR